MKELSNQQLIKLVKEGLKKLEAFQNENISLHKQVEDLNEKLIESEALKSHFISNVTNEIVNPFASVLGLSQNIMHLKGEELSKAPDLAALIYDESAFLDFQLGNIFAAARIEAGEMIPEIGPVDVERLLEEIVKKLSHEIEKKQLIIKIERPSGEALIKSQHFNTDHDKLKLALLNLFSNAVKFSAENSQIIVAFNLENDQLVLTITDEGIGMSDKELKRIFDRFHRLNRTINSVNPGNGLGLAVVEGLLYVLNAQIEIKSASGKGTQIVVFVPEISQAQASVDEDGLFNEEDEELF